MKVRLLTSASKRTRANVVVHMQKFKTPSCVTRDCREVFLGFGNHTVAIVNWKTRDVTMAKTDHVSHCSERNAACPTDHSEGGQSSSKGLQLTCQQQLFDGSRFKPKKLLHLWIHSLHLHVIGVHGALPNHKFVIFRTPASCRCEHPKHEWRPPAGFFSLQRHFARACCSWSESPHPLQKSTWQDQLAGKFVAGADEWLASWLLVHSKLDNSLALSLRRNS
jgi:hypothetical protein